MKLPPDYPALAVFDTFNGQCTQNFFKILEDNHVNVVLVTANCTHYLQPLDLSVNKPAKNFLQNKEEKG